MLHKPSHHPPVRQSIAVIGGGAIGSVFASAASAAGHQVTLCVRHPLQHVAIERNGVASIAALDIATAPEAVATVDWVFIATKTQDTAGTASWLRRLVGRHTVVVLLQNGMDGVEIAKTLVGDAPVLPSIVYIAAERRARGRIVHYFGDRIEMPAGEHAQRLAACLAGHITVAEQSDFVTASWRKLICNIALNPITALTGQRFGVLTQPRIRDLAAGLIREAATVGNAAGAHFTPEDIEGIVAYCCQLSPQGGTSMLYDRINGNRLEYEHLTGTIVRLAGLYGVAVPLNSAIMALLSAIDAHAADNLADVVTG